MGYQLTVLWADVGGRLPVVGGSDGAETVGIPVPHYLRDWAERSNARMHRRYSRGLLGYRDAGGRRRKEAELAARRARLDTDSEPFGLRMAAQVHRVRGKLLGMRTVRGERRYTKRRGKLPWQKELARVTDLDGAFYPWLEKLNPDLLHVHDIHLLSAAVHYKRRRAARGEDVKLIYDAHEYVKGMIGRDPFEEGAYMAMEAELVGDADGLITVSEPIADALVADFGLPTRPTVVLNSRPLADGRGAPGSAPDLRSELGLAADVPLAVYAGVLHANRSLMKLVEAFTHLEGMHLALVCVPNAHYPVALELGERAEALGLGDRVHLVEPVPPGRVPTFLSTATVGVHPMELGLPNHEMALPNKLFDYLWAGLPVAVSNAAQMAEVVRGYGFGETFDPSDPEQIAAAIRSVVERRPIYVAAVDEPGWREQYSWEAQERRLGALYQAVLPISQLRAAGQ
jgi:glycosyltransferase involved in cell wall biosynthesis